MFKHLQYVYDPASPQVNHPVLLIALKVKRTGLFCLVLAGVLTCVGSGILVGLTTGKADLAVAVSSAVAAMIAVLEVVLFWCFK